MAKICQQLTVRNCNREDMQQMVDWAAAEGWNPGLHDADSFYQTDPTGFFLAYDLNEVIGAISAVANDASFGIDNVARSGRRILYMKIRPKWASLTYVLTQLCCS